MESIPCVIDVGKAPGNVHSTVSLKKRIKLPNRDFRAISSYFIFKSFGEF